MGAFRTTCAHAAGSVRQFRLDRSSVFARTAPYNVGGSTTPAKTPASNLARAPMHRVAILSDPSTNSLHPMTNTPFGHSSSDTPLGTVDSHRPPAHSTMSCSSLSDGSIIDATRAPGAKATA